MSGLPPPLTRDHRGESGGGVPPRDFSGRSPHRRQRLRGSDLRRAGFSQARRVRFPRSGAVFSASVSTRSEAPPPVLPQVGGVFSASVSARSEAPSHLVDSVLPNVPVRQWVLTFPYPVRYWIAWNHDRARELLSVFVEEVLGFYRRRAKELGITDGRSGTVTAIQRCGSALVRYSFIRRSPPSPRLRRVFDLGDGGQADKRYGWSLCQGGRPGLWHSSVEAYRRHF